MSVRREKPALLSDLPLSEKGERRFEDRRRTLLCVEDREASTPDLGSRSSADTAGDPAEDS